LHIRSNLRRQRRKPAATGRPQSRRYRSFAAFEGQARGALDADAVTAASAKRGDRTMRVLQLVAVLLTALELVPAGAHLFELAHKIDLSKEQYFVVQQIYRGWAFFGIVLIAAIVANLVVAAVLWRRASPYWPSLCAGLLLAITLAVFFAWTYPANQATGNWTVAPADWQRLRVQWELSHAANAALTFAALCFATWSTVAANGSRRR
jgi:hypothetical protein